MDLQSTETNNTLIITVNEARIDASAAIRFKDSMRALTDDGPPHAVLDLSKVVFIDSSGLGAIVAARKQLRAGQQLDLAGLTPDVAKVFRLTRMDAVFVIHDSPDSVSGRAAG
jgi:anti-sigma B factor antagonist